VTWRFGDDEILLFADSLYFAVQRKYEKNGAGIYSPRRDPLENVRRNFGSVRQQFRVVENFRMISVQLEVEFVARWMTLARRALAAPVNKKQRDDNVHQVRRRPFRGRTRSPHFRLNPAHEVKSLSQHAATLEV